MAGYVLQHLTPLDRTSVRETEHLFVLEGNGEHVEVVTGVAGPATQEMHDAAGDQDLDRCLPMMAITTLESWARAGTLSERIQAQPNRRFDFHLSSFLGRHAGAPTSRQGVSVAGE